MSEDKEDKKIVEGLPWKKGGRGWKRKDQEDGDDPPKSQYQVDESLLCVKVFRKFQEELDAKHDKYENLVKCSRDVTTESKRIIFLLHRITGCKEETAEKLLSEASIRIKELQSSNLRKIAEQLQDEDIFYFLRSISPGLQEYVEAVSFYYYLKDNRLVGFEELEAELVFCKENDVSSKEDSQLSKQVKVPLPPQDYMLGIADLTGELMRKCINSVGQGNLEEPFQLCHFIQNIYDAFLSFGNTPGREFSRKIQTLRQSLKKVENACYTIRVRGSEIPKHMLIHVFNEEISENLECDLTV